MSCQWGTINVLPRTEYSALLCLSRRFFSPCYRAPKPELLQSLLKALPAGAKQPPAPQNGFANGHANGIAKGHANGVANGFQDDTAHARPLANGHQTGSKPPRSPGTPTDQVCGTFALAALTPPSCPI